MNRTAIYRACAALSIVLLWAQFALTSRYAHVDGALHGPKKWFYVAALALATWCLLRRAVGEGSRLELTYSPRSQASTSIQDATPLLLSSVLLTAIFVWFPLRDWSQLPYLDNWQTRFHFSVDTAALLSHGAVSGWNWHFLGGYHLSSDITQGLGHLLWPLLAVLEPRPAYHLLHVILLLAAPAIVYADLRLAGERRVAAWATGLASIGVAGLSYPLFRSGDSNSLAGLVMTMLALLAGHAAAQRRRWGAPLLIVAMTLVAWSHTGFLIYAALFLLLDAALARDWRRAARAIVASATALVGALPMTWELWRYPSYFIANNVIFDPQQPVDWLAIARKLYYNVELLWLPGRWFNDHVGLTYVLAPLLAFTAWYSRSRARFYAAAALGVLALMRLQTAETAYVFVRPMHLVAIFAPVATAGFIDLALRERWRAWTIAGLTAIYLQIWWHPVPHVRDLDEVQPPLVAQMRGLDGALVLLENSPHRDMDADPARETAPTPFSAHFEGVVPRLTGQRLYANLWDGWMFCPQRDQVLAGGAFKGAALAVTPPASVHAELRKWGVRHLLVWTDAAKRFLDGDPRFVRRWRDERWTHYEFLDADPRDVVTQTGEGRLADLTMLGGRVRLTNVTAGERVIARTNFYPAWTAIADGAPVALLSDNGQLAFDAPKSGTYEVELIYPRRIWLFGVAVVGMLIGLMVLRQLRTE